MTLEEFQATLLQEKPPEALGPLLCALWWDARGDFDRAHEIADDEALGQDAAWIHAYLHRKQGESANAGYWYLRARQPHAQMPPADEWRAIAGELLRRSA